jgi:hypothetical protein
MRRCMNPFNEQEGYPRAHILEGGLIVDIQFIYKLNYIY